VIAGTDLARNGKELAALARLTHQEQRTVADKLAQHRFEVSVNDAVRIVRGVSTPVVDADELQLARLVALWIKAGAKARHRFVEYLRDGGHLAAAQPIEAKQAAKPRASKKAA
jgi:hypothetical protein